MRLPLEFPKALSVSELVALVRGRLESGHPAVWVRGEVSNLKRATSGHLYFTLKDRRAQLRVVMFRLKAQALSFSPEDGLEVIVRGSLTVYEDRGDLQLLAQSLDPYGLGAQTLAFEQLKQRLLDEGLFDPARKRPLPRFPRRVGIVTSPVGAAIADLVEVLSRRRASLPVLLAPVRVQGSGAAAEIVRALDELGRHADVDVVILARGGGSSEDLSAFNAEAVVRAIARSRAPVVSAVGHEVDVTLADGAADLRAPTPSAAAELCAHSSLETVAHLGDTTRRLAAALGRRLAEARLGLERVSGVRALRAAEALTRRHALRLDDLRLALDAAAVSGLTARRQSLTRAARDLERLDVKVRLGVGRERFAQTSARLLPAARSRIGSARSRLAELAARLSALSPLAVLGRGYALALLADGAVLTRPAQVAAGDKVDLLLAEGRVGCRVETP